MYAIGAIQGDEGLERFYQTFCIEQEGDRWKKYRWNLQAHTTKITEEAAKVLPVESEQYYWMIEKVEKDIFKAERPLHILVAEYASAVKEYISRLDNYIWSMNPREGVPTQITPEIAKERFELIRQGKVKILMLQ